VAGTSYGSAAGFLEILGKRALPFVVQIRPSTVVQLKEPDRPYMTAAEVFDRGVWRKISAQMPDGTELECSAAKLATVTLITGTAKLFAAQVGGIKGIHRGTIIGLASFDAALTDLIELVVHASWIRRSVRRAKRKTVSNVRAEPAGAASAISARANIAIARRQDARNQAGLSEVRADGRGFLGRAAPILNVVELFAGAGGMGLGFLLGGGAKARYRIVYSGEANPIFVKTLQSNHQAFARVTGCGPRSRTPELLEAVDLRQKKVLARAVTAVTEAGGAQLLIGGPPCQGFSMANRNSQSSSNPNNQLIDVFINYVLRFRPLGFLMENVQGIVWTSNAGTSVSVVDVIERRLKAAGYLLFPKLVDAIWYGVPQHRTRFFLMGLHRDLGYTRDDFGPWGPFPKPSHGAQLQPFVSVRDAIADLPRIGNGQSEERSSYAEPRLDALKRNAFLRYARAGAERGTIDDHVTSRHADYVIDRYRKIPAGMNWESIREEMTNYADVSRTHSNIYRRLRWNEPSITIGHYRKSMLIHPSQHRGLSLREASRLQSFPDWFRFAGTTNGKSGGLVHKQQQLANAVCPLVTKAIAEFMLSL
jgi:DNA-cytosine methyltransferase